MKTQHTRAALASGALLAALAAPAAAQVPLTPRALGMAGAYVASARGHEALLLNPANLGLPGTPRWSIAFPQLGAGATLLGPSFADLPDMINVDDATAERKSELLASVPASGTEVRIDSRDPLFVLQNHRFALGVSYGVTAGHSVGKDILDLVVNGYQQGRTDYSVGRTEGWRMSYLDLAAGFGHRVGPVSLGATGHYYRGRSLVRSRMFEPRFDLAAQDLSVDYVGVQAHGGNGYGVDLGAAVQPHPSFTLSAAVANAFGRMKWTEALTARSVTLHKGDFNADSEPWWIRDSYDQSEHPVVNGTATLQEYETAAGLYDEAYFPATLRVGAAWKPLKGTEVGTAYQSNLTEGRMSGWWDRSASVGIQQKLPLVTVRGGYASNLEDGRMVTGGLSLGPLQLGLARVDDGTTDGAARTGWLMTFGVSTRTPETLR